MHSAKFENKPHETLFSLDMDKRARSDSRARREQAKARIERPAGSADRWEQQNVTSQRTTTTDTKQAIMESNTNDNQNSQHTTNTTLEHIEHIEHHPSNVMIAEFPQSTNDKYSDGSLSSTYRFKYSITGKAAYGRLQPLLPRHWIDCSPYQYRYTSSSNDNADNADNFDENDNENLHFIWENAPRSETKKYRNDARCYSHLPNGIEILDDKWVLGRIFSHAENSENDMDPYFAPLETHCFRGRSGLESFSNRMRCNRPRRTSSRINCVLKDLDPEYNTPLKQKQALEPDNLWVIKDANSNGYGGIWIMNVNNVSSLSSSSMLLDQERSPLHENHRYVAQKYSWPPILYQGRKCHIRVYAVMMNGRAYVHKRCFLHVANEQFECHMNEDENENGPKQDSEGIVVDDFDPAVHITNCCANSHDQSKFAGEILADFDLKEGNSHDESIGIVPLHEFFPSVAASVKVLAEKTASYVQGGEKNQGFEYLGLDFILSHKTVRTGGACTQQGDHRTSTIPVAFLLEVNCPPSQDTATGLDHAEDLHNEVLSDLLKMWVIPNVVSGDRLKEPKETFGWKCVHAEDKSATQLKDEDLIQPSKAMILNKIRWGMFERRMKRADDQPKNSKETKEKHKFNPSPGDTTEFARSQYPYFNKDDSSITESKSRIFLENAGGSQVPTQVIQSMVESLSHRHRSIIGQKSKEDARAMSMTLLGGSCDRHKVFLGANASSLFDRLARRFVDSGFLSEGDEVILASENHLANVNPWKNAARETGAQIVWWTRKQSASEFLGEHCFASTHFNDLLSDNTRVVCISHSSNILGSARDLQALCKEVRQKCPRAHIVVDGVAAAPHLYPAVDKLGVDWYCVSYHKLFGPHIGVIVGRNDAVKDLATKSPKEETDPYRMLETGTINYEACSGIIGLGCYFAALASFERDLMLQDDVNNSYQTGEDPMQTPKHSLISKVLCQDLVKEAYRRINLVEKECIDYVVDKLRSCKLVQIIGDNHNLPIVSFLHTTIPSKSIVEWCSQHHIDIRCGSFLTTEILQTEFNVDKVCKGNSGGIVRISFCHYNNLSDAQQVVIALQSMPGWDK